MDKNHVMRQRQALAKVVQRTSVAQYNAAFRAIMLELTNTISDRDALFEYLCGLKDKVRQAVMVLNPVDL